MSDISLHSRISPWFTTSTYSLAAALELPYLRVNLTIFRSSFSSSTRSHLSVLCFLIVSLSMGTKYAVLIALTILSSSSMALGGSNDIGAFDIINKAEADIDVFCIALSGHKNIWNSGEINLASGSKCEKGVYKPATSIRCTFEMSGMLEENLRVWEMKDFEDDLPVACSECHWIVDINGFSIMNPDNGQYIQVARWTPLGI